MASPKKEKTTDTGMTFDNALAKPGDVATHPVIGKSTFVTVTRIENSTDGIPQYRVGHNPLPVYKKTSSTLEIRLLREIGRAAGEALPLKSTRWQRSKPESQPGA